MDFYEDSHKENVWSKIYENKPGDIIVSNCSLVLYKDLGSRADYVFYNTGRKKKTYLIVAFRETEFGAECVELVDLDEKKTIYFRQFFQLDYENTEIECDEDGFSVSSVTIRVQPEKVVDSITVTKDWSELLSDLKL